MPRWLWIVAAALGFVYLFLIPPFQIADEPEHMARAYQLARGELYAEKRGDYAGGVFPQSVASGLKFLSRIPHNGEQRTEFAEVKHEFFHGLRFRDVNNRTGFYPFSNMAMYSPAPYLPQIIALKIADGLNLTLVQANYFTRLVTYFFVLLLLGTAVFWIGKGTRTEWQLFLVLGLPMALSQLASASADSLCIVYAILNLALLFRVLNDPENKVYFSLFVFTAILLSLSKLVFFMLPLAVVPPLFFSQKRNQNTYIKLVIILAAAVLPNILWSMAVREIYVPARLDGVNAFQQLQFLKTNPAALFAAMWVALSERGGDFLSQFVAMLGWLDVPVRFSREYFFIFLGGAIALPKFAQRDIWEGYPGLKASAIICFLGSFFFLFFSQYLAWTHLGAKDVDGIQGRYFLAMAPLLLIALPKIRFKHLGWEWIFFRVTIFCWFFIQTKAIWAVLKRYWL